MRKLIFQLQLFGIVLLFSVFPGFSLKAGNFEIRHSGFKQLVLVHGRVINYASISSPKIEHVPSVLRAKLIKPTNLVPGWQDETDADAAWRKYYRKARGKGVACTASGAILLAGGVATVVAGTLIYNKVINSFSANGGEFEDPSQLNDTLAKQFNVGVSLLSLGSVMLCSGIPLLCSGAHFLSKAKGIKRDAEHHDVIVYWAPAINPAIRNYACAFTLKF